jgi:DNA mismatch repair ATPase MutS
VKINERLDAVEDLITHQNATDTMRARFGKLPDLEKLLAKIFTYSIKHSVKAIYFEDVNLQKMRDFRQILCAFQKLPDNLDPLILIADELRSTRLQ